MPDPIVCPHCHEQLEIPVEYHGRPVRCANCQNVFVATAGDVPVLQPRSRRSGDDDPPPWRDDDRPRRPRREAREDVPPPRKSNLGVFALMFLTASAIAVCCGGFDVLMFTQVNPTLHPYTSAKGKFKVEFPGENPTEGPTTNPADDTIEGVQVTAARDYGQERYTVKCYDLKPAWRKLPATEALDNVAKAEMQALGVPGEPPPRREADIEHQGFPALDLYADHGNGFTGRDAMMRCILVGERVYVVAVQAQKTQPEYWWLRKYFLSFEITDPTAKPPKKDEPKKEKKQD